MHGRGDGRNLGLHPTPEIQEALEMGPSDQCALNGGAYGRVDAPFLWFCGIRDELLQQGCKQHHSIPAFSPMVRLIRMESIVHVVGSLGLHVDDGIGGGNKAFMNMLFHELKSVSSLGRLKLGNLSTLGYTSNNGMMGA